MGRCESISGFPNESLLEEAGPGKIAEAMRKRFCNEIGDADVL